LDDDFNIYEQVIIDLALTPMQPAYLDYRLMSRSQWNVDASLKSFEKRRTRKHLGFDS